MIKIEKKFHSSSSAENLYGLVSDVESYSEFIPWCEKSIIERRVHEYFFAKLNMKYLLFSGSFVSKVTLYDYEKKINALGALTRRSQRNVGPKAMVALRGCPIQ